MYKKNYKMGKNIKVTEETKNRFCQIIDDDNISFSNVFSNEIEQLTPQFFDEINKKIQKKDNVILSKYEFKIYKSVLKFAYAGSIAASILFGIYISHNYIDTKKGLLGSFKKIEKFSFKHTDNYDKIIINYF